MAENKEAKKTMTEQKKAKTWLKLKKIFTKNMASTLISAIHII